MKTYYLFGDSIMKGVMPDEDGNYHSSDAIDFPGLESKHGVKIVNYSMPTFTSLQVSAWAKTTMKRAEVPDHVFFEFGGNDCDYNWKAISAGECSPAERHRVPADTFKATYADLIDFFKEKGAEPIVVIAPKIHVARYLDHLFSQGVDRQKAEEFGINVETMKKEFGEYAEVMNEVADAYGCPVIRLDDRFPDYDGLDDLYSPDGMHPSRAGYALFHKSFDEFFSSNK